MSFPPPLAAIFAMADSMPDMPGMEHGADATQSAIFDMLVLSRWVHFSCVFVLFGSSLFWLGTGRAYAGLIPFAQQATLRLLRGAAPLAFLSGLGWLTGMIANMTGGFGEAILPGNLRLFFFETGFGLVWTIRLGLLILAVAAAWGPLKGTARLMVLAAAGALLLINQAWLGHSAEGGTDGRGLLMILVYCGHMAATGVWAGGLPPLLFALADMRMTGGAHVTRDAHAILLRFSGFASVAVILIVLSGAATAWFRTAGSFGILAHTSYGAVLLSKTILVAIMLSLAAYNRFRAMPALTRASGPAPDSTRGILASIGVELAFGVLVLAAAAILGITPPPE